MSSLSVSLLGGDDADSQQTTQQPEQRDEAPAVTVTWSDYWRLLTDRQLLPLYALSLCVLATRQLDDNFSLLLSQGACIEEGVTPELCRHQDKLSTSAEWHDVSLRIAQRAAKLASYGQTGNQLCQMSTMLFLGVASDRIGRKPVLQVVLLGCILDYAVIATVRQLNVLVAIHAITGVLCGPMYQTYAVMVATDLTSAQDRMLTMALMHGLMFAAGAGAPICIGGLIKLLTTSSRGYIEALRLTFGIGSALLVCGLVSVRFCFAESLQGTAPARERGPDRQCVALSNAVVRKGNPISMWRLLAETRQYTVIPTLVTIIFAINHFASGASVLVPLYTEHMFGWEAFEMGIFKSVGGILNIFASFVFLPALVICCGERRAAITMMSCGLSGFILMGFSGITALEALPGDGSTGAVTTAGDGSPDASAGRRARVVCMCLGFPLHWMWFNVGTIYTAIGTQAVDKNQIASILSLWQFLNTFALMLSPLLFRWIYAGSVSWMPGLIWFAESGLFLVGFACFFALPDWTQPMHSQKSDSQEPAYIPASTETIELARKLNVGGLE